MSAVPGKAKLSPKAIRALIITASASPLLFLTKADYCYLIFVKILSVVLIHSFLTTNEAEHLFLFII